MEKRELVSDQLNAPLGVFCQAIEVSNAQKLVFVSGLTSRAPDGSVIGEGDIKLQTETILKNMQAVLAESGGTLKNVVKVTAYIRDMEMFKEIHEVRAQYFEKPYPASTMVEVSRLVDPRHVIEIEAIAVIG
ncbi:RidA family protein [Alicyclobacillus sp. SO9]|uniref:RidA family protein n=1 Tax=Alicyclobacillus sp. SO9 TaxID=2665646 RepID=UPI0018E728F4|nr:RidA family protein [Alicyclobacillus sp. SO9]QQE80506.1 RidA family protein [Alicyclobacillus sp. SO9]